VRGALLIAGNFVRENRWPVLLLILWGLGSGIAAAMSVGSSLDDALFFLKQQAVYSVFFTVFLSASALYNQRRSRRILAVLSKGIQRYEYLSGIVIGFTGISLFYAIALGLTGAWTYSRTGSSPASILPMVLMLLVASVLAGTLALFFSTFMNPLFTLLSTSAVLGASAMFGRHTPWLLPGYTLMEGVMSFSFRTNTELPISAVLAAVIESVFLLIAASTIFARKDIAVSIE
jgi:hypothetical protein